MLLGLFDVAVMIGLSDSGRFGNFWINVHCIHKNKSVFKLKTLASVVSIRYYP